MYVLVKHEGSACLDSVTSCNFDLHLLFYFLSANWAVKIPMTLVRIKPGPLGQ